MKKDQVAEAVRDVLTSDDLSTQSGDPANVVDAIAFLGESIRSAAKHLGKEDATDPQGAIEFHGMMVEEAGKAIAEAIDGLAEAIRDAVKAFSDQA